MGVLLEGKAASCPLLFSFDLRNASAKRSGVFRFQIGTARTRITFERQESEVWTMRL